MMRMALLQIRVPTLILSHSKALLAGGDPSECDLCDAYAPCMPDRTGAFWYLGHRSTLVCERRVIRAALDEGG